jgi:hypothetical protein
MRRSKSLAEVLRARLEEKGLVLAGEGGDPVELRPPAAAALVEANGSSQNLARFASRSTWTCGGSARSLE